MFPLCIAGQPASSVMSNRRLVAILASVVGITAVVILILVLIPKATVVEFRVRVDEAVFAVRAPRGPDSATSLLSSEVKVQSAEVRGFAQVRAARPNGVPFGASLIAGREEVLQIRDPDLISPTVRLGSAAQLAILPSGRNRVQLRITADDARSFGWQLRTFASGTVGLRLAGATFEDTASRDAFPGEEWTDAAGNPPVLISGGTDTASIGLHFPSGENTAVTKLRVIDLPSGKVSSEYDLPVALSQKDIVTVDGDRLVVTSTAGPRENSPLLLEANLAVSAPRFFNLVGTQVDSHLLGGQIRFPAGERATIELEPDFLLEVAYRDALTLKSLRVMGPQLELVLWGTPSSVRLGPTAGLMREVLPSYFVWLYNHRLGTLAFSLLAWMVGTTIAALKLFGWVKS